MTDKNDTTRGGNSPPTLTNNALHKALIQALANAPATAVAELIKEYPTERARIIATARAVGIKIE